MNRLSLISANLYEDIIAWKNLRQAELAFRAEPSKVGHLSLSFCTTSIANKIYKQVESLSILELSKIKVNFNENDWFTLMDILTQARTNLSEDLSI